MRFDQLAFYFMFPQYFWYKGPMYSEMNEDDKEATLEIVVPGFEKEAFKLYFEDEWLYLEIENKKKSIKYSLFNNSFATDFDLKSASAKYNNGILEIKIPKKEKAKSKKIELRVS